MSRWITRVEAAQLLGVSLTAVSNAIDRGDLTPRRMPGRRRPSLEEEQVRALVERRLVEAQRARDRRAEQLLRTRHPRDDHEWLTTREVSERLGISRVRVDQLVRKGNLPFTVGPQGRRSFRADQVELVRRARAARYADRTATD